MKKSVIIGIIIGIAIVTIIAGSSINQEETGQLTNTEDMTGDTADSVQNFDSASQSTSTKSNTSQDCLGSAGCFTGTVTKIVDGDTIHVDDQSVRFALASAPGLKGYGGIESRDFIETICPVGSAALVDEDDGQILGSYGRLVGMIKCNDLILNEELLDANLGHFEDRFCSSSEFANTHWAIKHGCTPESEEKSEVTVQKNQNDKSKCDESYPDFCIPYSPPDLNCNDISQKEFTVLSPDPHGFDGDGDGIGCES